ncbi:MAG: cytidine deaminase [Acidobacteria bacterium]|nr:cytidine deaminase [Acidobacteriota bacterium]
MNELISAALKARSYAYAPYSKFAVGAVVESRNGQIFTGCNVENASYGLTICAERVALCKAVSEGVRELSRVVVVADTSCPVPPCGACRQLIIELAGPETEVVLANLAGEQVVTSAAALLPSAFDRHILQRFDPGQNSPGVCHHIDEQDIHTAKLRGLGSVDQLAPTDQT